MSLVNSLQCMPILYRDSPSISFLFVSVSLFFFFSHFEFSLSPEFSCWHWLVYSLAYITTTLLLYAGRRPLLSWLSFYLHQSIHRGNELDGSDSNAHQCQATAPALHVTLRKYVIILWLFFFSVYLSLSSEGCERVFKLENNIYIYRRRQQQ